MGAKRGTLEQRFWRYVQKSDGCWEWTGARSPQNYGQIRVGGRTVNAHRLSYELASGEPIPPGMFVCHHCDNRPCVRPDHLFLGTCSDNFQDMVNKHGWPDKPNQPRGSAVKNSILTEAAVRQIRAEWNPKAKNGGVIARRFGIQLCTLHDVVYRRSWRHV